MNTKPDEWLDNCDSYLCPCCGYECDNPNRLEYRGWYCPRCRKQLRWGEEVTPMNDYHNQMVEIILKKDSDLYRRIEKYAEKERITVVDAVSTLVMLGAKQAIGDVLDRLEK